VPCDVFGVPDHDSVTIDICAIDTFTNHGCANNSTLSPTDPICHHVVRQSQGV